MATVVASDIKVHDIIQVANSRDFARPNSFTQVNALVREIATVPGSRDVSRFVVFEIAEDTDNIRSGTSLVMLDKDSVGSYGLDPRKNWVVLMDPVEVAVDPNRYYVSRTGTLTEHDTNKLLSQISGMGGDDFIKHAGDGPQGFRTRTREAELGASGGFRQRFIGTPDEEKIKEERAERRRKYRARLPNEGYVVDLPIDFAGKVADLPQGLIDALKKQGVTSFRQAYELAKTPENFSIDGQQQSRGPSEFTIDDAIKSGYLAEDTRALRLVTEPIDKKSKRVTTLKELFILTQDGGKGFDNYIGLASKTAKSRLALSEAAVKAWEKYQAASSAPEKSNADLARDIRTAWGQLMTEYSEKVRPHIGKLEDGGPMLAPERIPEKFIRDGKLVFTFPKLSL